MASSIILKEKNRRLSLVLLSYSAPVAIFTCLFYLACRVWLAWRNNGGTVIWLTILVEGLIGVPRTFSQLSISRIARKADGDRLPQTVGEEEWPNVDVFVTYCGESVETVINTLQAACNLDYPQGLVRVIVLDDSSSPKVAEQVCLLGREYCNLFYASRGVRVTTHSKAANLNFGLQFAKSLKKGSSAYVAVLDVDMIPESNWLRHVVPHVHNNPRAGLACPAQRFYNLPDGDPLDIKSDINPIDFAMLLQDFTNDAWCTGSGFVARRVALEDIGGFPEASLQEDILTSNYLSAAGWHSVHIPGSLQWGMGPETLSDCLRQCQRWKIGFLSIIHFAVTEGGSKLPPQTRLSIALWGFAVSTGSFIWTFVLVALPLLILTGQQLIPTNTLAELRMMSHVASLDFAAQSLYCILISSLMDFRMPFDGHLTTVWTQPSRAWITLRYFVIPKLFGHPIPNFTPTGIKIEGDAEHAARDSGSLIARSKAIFWDCGAIIHLLICIFCIAGADTWVRDAVRTFYEGNARNAVRLLLTGIAWPHVLWLWCDVGKAAFVPVSYAFTPIHESRKSERLVRSGSTGAKYASAKAKENYMRKPSPWFFLLKCCFYMAVNVILSRDG